MNDLEKRVKALEAWGAFLDGFSRGTESRFNEVEEKQKTLWKWANDTGAASFASQAGRIRVLEAKVESLTRTLDMLQEVIGIEVVITAQTHEGQCEKCDRVGQLNTENICEGCFYEELGVGNV